MIGQSISEHSLHKCKRTRWNYYFDNAVFFSRYELQWNLTLIRKNIIESFLKREAADEKLETLGDEEMESSISEYVGLNGLRIWSFEPRIAEERAVEDVASFY